MLSPLITAALSVALFSLPCGEGWGEVCRFCGAILSVALFSLPCGEGWGEVCRFCGAIVSVFTHVLFSFSCGFVSLPAGEGWGGACVVRLSGLPAYSRYTPSGVPPFATLVGTFDCPHAAGKQHSSRQIAIPILICTRSRKRIYTQFSLQRYYFFLTYANFSSFFILKPSFFVHSRLFPPIPFHSSIVPAESRLSIPRSCSLLYGGWSASVYIYEGCYPSSPIPHPPSPIPPFGIPPYVSAAHSGLRMPLCLPPVMGEPV